MGATCAPTAEIFDYKQDASSTNDDKFNMDAKSEHRDSNRRRFTFVLNDEEILFSPSAASTAKSTSSNTFTFNDTNKNVKALDIPIYQLRNTSSIDADVEFDEDVDQETEEHKYYIEHESNASNAILQILNNDDLFRSKLMTKMTDEDLILAQLYKNGEIIPKPNPSTANPQTLTSNQSQSLLVTPKHKPNLYRSDTNASWDVSDMEDLQDEMKQQLRSLSQSNVKTIIDALHLTDRQSMVLQTVMDRCIDSISCSDSDSDSDSDSENDEESDDDADIMSYNDYDALFHKISKSDGSRHSHKRSSSLHVNHMKTDTIPTFDWIESGKGTNLVQTLSCDWDSEDMESEEDQMKRQLVHLSKRSSNGSNGSSGISKMHLL